jgi:predicted phage terminase large subunit-like protein
LQDTSTIQKLKDNLTYESLWSAITQKSFYQFVKYFWDTIIAEEPVWNWHIEYLCNELQEIGMRVARREPKEYDYYLINVPPGSSKSTIISEMYPIWCWTIDATQRFICGSYASTPAEDIAEKSYNIYKSDKFKRLFPHLVEESSGGKTHFKNGLKGERYTTSTGSAITGIHAHQKIIDDPMSPQIAYSKVERDRANKWVSETLGSRDVSAEMTVTIVVMQRLHQQDTTGYLLAKEKEGLRIKHICIPAEVSNNIKPELLKEKYVDGLFDPKRFSISTLVKKKTELGSYGYAGQMQQRPSPEDGGIWKKHWFQVIRRDRAPDGMVVNFQGDTAYTANSMNDPTGMIPYYVENNQVFITHAISVYKEFPELLEWVPAYTKQKGYDGRSRIWIEPKASGKSIVQMAKRSTNLNILESQPPKEDKVTNAHSVSAIIETGKVILHEGAWNDEFLDQISAFPNGDHDEYIDIIVAIVKRHLMPSGQNNSINAASILRR